MSVPAGATRIQPGVYDLDGTMHLEVGELLRDQGIADTPENRQTVTDMAHKMFGDLGIEVSEADQ